MILNYIHWNVNPEIFPDSFLSIRWYGLFFVLAFYISYVLLARMFRKEGIELKLLDTLTMYMLVATIAGARIGHCLFYEPEYYLKNPLEILYVWQGGLASHGAGIAIVFAIWLFARKHKEVSFLWIFDRVVIMVAMAGFWIRMGNLMNSEIIGNPTTLPWGFIFERLKPYGITGPHHPAQLYEAFSYLLIFFFLFWFYLKQNRSPRPGQLFAYFLILLFSVRFFIEFLKENQVDFESGMVLNMGQWLSIPFVAGGILILIFTANAKSKSQKDMIADKPD